VQGTRRRWIALFGLDTEKFEKAIAETAAIAVFEWWRNFQ
jgi:hypothetical protein